MVMIVERSYSSRGGVQLDSKEHLFRGINLYEVVLDMIAGANLTTEVCIPVRNIPFETFCADGRWTTDRYNSHILSEEAWPKGGMNTVFALRKQEADTVRIHEKHVTLEKGFIPTCRVETLQLGEALVEPTSDASKGNHIQQVNFRLLCPVSDTFEAFGQISRVLVRIMENWYALLLVRSADFR